MFKALTPIFAILISFGLVVTHVQPSFLAIKAMERETDEYKNALEHANVLQARIDEKLDQKRSFNQVDLIRLEQMIPTDVDEVDMILLLDGLAKGYDMSLRDIKIVGDEANVSEESTRPRASNPRSTGGADTAVDPAPAEDEGGTSRATPRHTDISFAVEGTYEQFKDFMSDLEDSLALAEVTKLEFDAAEGDVMRFDTTVRFFSYNAHQ